MKPVQIEYTLDISKLEEPLDVILSVNYFHESKPNRHFVLFFHRSPVKVFDLYTTHVLIHLIN